MRTSITQVVVFAGALAAALPCAGLLGLLYFKAPNIDRVAENIFDNVSENNAKSIVGDVRGLCRIMDLSLKNSASKDTYELERESLKESICKNLENSKIGATGNFWVVEFLDEFNTVVRVSKKGLKTGKIIEKDFNELDLKPQQKAIGEILSAAKKSGEKINFVKRSLSDMRITGEKYTAFCYLPEFKWVIGVSFAGDIPEKQTLSKTKPIDSVAEKLSVKTGSKKMFFDVLTVSLILLIGAVALSLIVSSNILVGFKSANRALKLLRSGKVREAAYILRSASFNNKNSFSEMDEIFQNIAMYINRINESIVSSKSKATRIAELSRRISASLFAFENFVKTEDLSVRQVYQQSNSTAFSAHALSETASESSREISEFANQSKNTKTYFTELRRDMRDLSLSAAETANRLKSLLEMSGQIFQSLSEIEKFGENANMLSFNIAIAAEKDGGASAGLSAVSREIHKIAQNIKELGKNVEIASKDLQNSLAFDIADVSLFVDKIGDASAKLSSLTGDFADIDKYIFELNSGFSHLSKSIAEQFEISGKLSVSMDIVAQTSEKIRAKNADFKSASDLLKLSSDTFKGVSENFS